MAETPPQAKLPLDGMRVALLVAEGVEDLEYWVTLMRLREGGATVTSVGTSLERVRGKNGLAVAADRLAADTDPAELDALVIPAVGLQTSSGATSQ